MAEAAETREPRADELAEALVFWRGSRADMESYDAATGEQVSFIYRAGDAERLVVGGGHDPVGQCAAIIAAHNAVVALLRKAHGIPA